MRTLIIGAAGQIGRLLVPILVEAGQRPRALVRRPGQDLQPLGAEVVQGDLEVGIDHVLRGCDKVVFTAGSGGHTGADKTVLVDLWGAMKAIDAARRAGIQQFVMVSSRGAEDPDKGPSAIKHYTVCKKVADDHLMRSGVPYTILRPGRLTNDPARLRVSTALPDVASEQWIPRADVAHVIAHSLTHDYTHGRIYPLTHGEQSIDQALR